MQLWQGASVECDGVLCCDYMDVTARVGIICIHCEAANPAKKAATEDAMRMKSIMNV